MAGRRRAIRYWASRKGGGYFTTVGGAQVELALGPDDEDHRGIDHGPTFQAALKKWLSLLALDTNKGTDEYLVSECLNQYRAHLRKTRETDVPGIFDAMAKGFSQLFGQKRCCDLVPGEVQKWLDAQDNWNDTSKNTGGRLILCAFSWARKKGYIRTDPLAGRIDLPTPVKRGRDARMPGELCDVLLAEADQAKGRRPHFALFLRFLRETGCRPKELRMAEGRNLIRGKIVFRWNATQGYTHKTARKTQRDRTIFLSDELWTLATELAARTPDGPIFRTPRNCAWSEVSLNHKWLWLVSRPAVKECAQRHGYRLVVRCVNGVNMPVADVRMYNFRHTFASEYLDATSDVWTLAQLLGNSVQMIEQRYGHPDQDKIHAKLKDYHRSK